jgi:hypothetical protein
MKPFSPKSAAEVPGSHFFVVAECCVNRNDLFKYNQKMIPLRVFFRCLLYLLLSLAVFIGFSGGLFASGSVGRSGAAFLEVPVGARPIAMGDAFTAGTDDLNVMHYNPAGLGTLQYPVLSIFHDELILDSRYENITAAFPYFKGFFGLSSSVFWVPPFEKIDINGNSNGKVSFYNSATTVSFGRLTGPVLLGGSVKYIYQKIDTMTYQSVAMDLGIQKQLYMYTPFVAPVRNFTVGASILNLGTNVGSSPLPRMLRLGTSYLPTKWMKLNVDMTESLIGSSDVYDFTSGFDESFRLNCGMELSWQEMLFFRCGYRFNDVGHYSLGFGFNYAFSNVAFTVDTSYSDAGIFGPIYSINVGFKLIPKVITSEDKRKAEKYYQDGIRFYVGDDLESAISSFRKSRDYNPYQKNIEVKIQDLETLQKLKEENKKLETE